MMRGTADLVAAARAAGVARFVQMSALGTSEATSRAVPYYGAKWAIEREVKASGLEYVLVRPSFVFGRGGALPTFVKQVKLSPVVTVIGPGTQRIQPVWLEDVAQFFAHGRRRSTRRRAARGSSAGPTSSPGTSSTSRSPGCSASNDASSTSRSRSRGPARS